MQSDSSVDVKAMNTQQATGLHLRQLISVFHRRWKLIAISSGVAACLVVTIWLTFAPRYTAIAQLVVDPPRGVAAPGELAVAGVLDDAAIQTHAAALLSQNHLQRVFDSIVAEHGTEPKERAGLLWPEEFSIENFTTRINAFRDTRSRMIGITYTSTDPAFAAAVANRSMEFYLTTLTERGLSDRNDALRNLSKQIPLARAEVERAEAALQSYRLRNGFTDAGRIDVVHQELSDLNRQLALAKSDLAERNARLANLKNEQTIDQNRPREENGTLETRVRQLERRIAMLRDSGAEGNKPEVQLRELQREGTAFAQLYENLVQRQRTSLAEGNVQPDVRVLSNASIPTIPSSFSPLLLMPPAMVLALIAAGLLAVLLELNDSTLRTEREITDALGVACAGIIPKVAGPRSSLLRRLDRKAIRYSDAVTSSIAGALRLAKPRGSRKTLLFPATMTDEKARRPYQEIRRDERHTEALRSVVAAALHLAKPPRSPKTLLVTSSIPGEGKTTLAISFASFAAVIQRRVLLIDLSFRGPSIADELGEPADGSIQQALEGRPLAEMIRPAPILGFDYLPLARCSADPVAVIAGERLPRLLDELKQSYDCIVIDGAAVLSATETRLVASMVDRVLFAVKWGSTPREVAQNALDLLQRSGFGKDDLGRVVTAVITQVDLKKHARYRYRDFGESLAHVRPGVA